MSKTLVIAQILKVALIVLLLASIAGFCSFMNAYGVFLASVTTLITWGVFKNYRWSYFAAAAWGFAAYQLAKEGYEFQSLKHYVMTAGTIVIPVALFLHEILGKKHDKNAQKSVTNPTNDHEMPQ